MTFDGTTLTVNQKQTVGTSHSNPSTLSSIAGGTTNSIYNSNCSFIGGGLTNCVTGEFSFIGGGNCNKATGRGNTIGGGGSYGSIGNYTSNLFTTIAGGYYNCVTGEYGAILGGRNNTANFDESFIVGSQITSQLQKTTSVNKLVYYAAGTDTNFLDNPEVAGEIVFFGTFRETVAAGQLVVFTNNGTIGWHLADADTTTESTGLLGISLSAKVDGNANTTGVLVRGFARSSTYYTTAGDSDILYVSNTPGGITDTAPTGSGDVVRIVGYMVDDTFDLIYFCPDTTWVQLV
jgi:hypothetical protein